MVTNISNENNNINYKEVAEKMYSLYITKKYPFIKQNPNGEYEWIYNWGDLENKEYQVLVRHLQRKQTIGIMCHTHTKFICFDIDFKDDKNLAKWYTYKIINTLKEFGFKDEHINTSFSGNKGYHVEIFFDDIISYKQIEYLYDLVMEEVYCSSEINDMTIEQLKDKIELRPKTNIGLKLPLSIHQVTKNICYYCDNSNLEPIKSINYILEIKQCPRDYIEFTIDNGKDFRKDREHINKFNNDIKDFVKPTKSQQLYNSEDYTIEYIEDLINNGLKIEGSRHHSLMKIARYYYQFGYTIEDNEKRLVEWMLRQDKRFYKSSELAWRKDVKLILEFVYTKGRGITGITRDVSINKEEMLEILKHDARKKKLLYYALIIHSKRYSIKNGEFYMTFEQIRESTGLAKDTIIKYIEELKNDGEIEIIRKGERSKTSFKNLPNKYKIINKNIRWKNESNSYIVDRNSKDLDKEFNNNIIYLFDKKEIKKLIPNKQYRDISKLYA